LTVVSDNPALETEIARYLKTGDYDPYYRAWPEGGMLVRAQKVDAALREALIKAVRNRAQNIPLPVLAGCPDLTSLTRAKILPMVNGLFPESERSIVTSVLEKSVVFLTPENIESVLEKTSFLGTAWDLANLYLTSIGAPCLSDEAPRLDGLSQETTCFVSMRYFSQKDRFADFIVHEAAHIFHNCKRETIGLPHTRTREWLLEINFGKRETFAYACEAYSRILELGSCRAQFKPLLEGYAATSLTSDERVDDREIINILADAITARNGWKRILGHCSPVSRKTIQEIAKKMM
jgi:hypothetical protein